MINKTEPTSKLWHKVFVKLQIPKNGIIVEVAPGIEPKIGNALSLLRFRGKIFLIEPNRQITKYIQRNYQQILPEAIVKVVVKPLDKVIIGKDIPYSVDALVASHPFDDMVMFYLKNNNYHHGTQTTLTVWKNFIEILGPNWFITSQYPSYTLSKMNLVKRQNSGFAVLDQLKIFYEKYLIRFSTEGSFGYKGNYRWWIIAKNPSKPIAFNRLGKNIFVTQQARKLNPKEYEIIYADKKYSIKSSDFAIRIDEKKKLSHSQTVITYADRQKDETGIGLSDNFGSGRAIYYKDRFNILGVGKTTLCKSKIPSHSTGNLEMIGAMRRIIISNWINYFIKRAPIHPLLVSLKRSRKFKWNKNPVPLALLIRIDDGALDRPSHVEYSPQIPVNFENVLTQYAMFDAEYFAYRLMLGAWSTSNYSLKGHIIDLESASFVQYRSPLYYTSSANHRENLFGLEGLGFIKILKQLAEAKNIKQKDGEIEKMFYKIRRVHLAKCFLLLLGVTDKRAVSFLEKYQNCVLKISDQSEKLSKKVGEQKSKFNLYLPIPDEQDPSLLDTSQLFKSLAKIYHLKTRNENAFNLLVRQTALSKMKASEANNFLRKVKIFIRDIFTLLDLLYVEKYLANRLIWHKHLQKMNQNMPTMFELNSILKNLAENYRLGKINAKMLGQEIKKLNQLPFYRKY